MYDAYETILRKISQSENPAVDQSVGLALLCSNSPERISALASVLLERANEHSYNYLVRSFHKLPSYLQREIIAIAEKLSGILRALCRFSDLRVRQNVVEIISGSLNTKLCYVLALLLRDEIVSIREQSARAFLAIACEVLDRMESGNFDKEYQEQFFDALSVALESFAGHLRTETIESAMLFGHLLPDSIWSLFTSQRSRYAYTAMEILRKRSLPKFAGFAFRAFTTSEMGKDAARIVPACRRTDFMSRWISFGWYRFNPIARKNLARIKEFKWLSGNYKILYELNYELQIRFIDILMLTSVPSKEKIEILKTLLITKNAFVQECVIFALMQLGDISDAKDLLHRALTIKDAIVIPPRLVRLIEDYLDNYYSEDILENQLSRKLHGRFRSSGYKYFEQAWQAIRDMDRADWRDVIVRVKHLDSDFNEHLRERLSSPDPSERIRALLVIRRGNIADEFLTDIYRLCEDDDATVRSAAIKTLACKPLPIAEHKIIEALEDEDFRVQANAIEALETFNNSDLTEILQNKLTSQNNRIRANAIKAILKPQYIFAINTLVAMLDHPDPNFRKSALWVMTQTVPVFMIERLKRVAENDPDAEVKSVAKRAIETIIASVKKVELAENSSE